MKFVNYFEEKLIATVTLNRPEVRNAFNPAMIKEIKEIFLKLSTRHDLRAIIFKGEGKIFCAGGDLHWMKDMVRYTVDQNKEDANKLFEMYEAILHCPVPIVGVAQGAAFGGALGLLACCDYVISEEKTQFCFSEVKLGIAPAVISAFVFKKCTLGQVGPYMLTGQIFSAKSANLMGLVHDVADDESLPDRIETTIGWLREVGPEAVRSTKTLIHSLSSLNWGEVKEETSEVIAERRVSAEGQEGLKSFLEKRKPSWRDL